MSHRPSLHGLAQCRKRSLLVRRLHPPAPFQVLVSVQLLAMHRLWMGQPPVLRRSRSLSLLTNRLGRCVALPPRQCRGALSTSLIASQALLALVVLLAPPVALRLLLVLVLIFRPMGLLGTRES